jgi:hypothetical protein
LRDFGKDQEVEENLTIFLVDLESSKCWFIFCSINWKRRGIAPHEGLEFWLKLQLMEVENVQYL